MKAAADKINQAMQAIGSEIYSKVKPEGAAAGAGPETAQQGAAEEPKK